MADPVKRFSPFFTQGKPGGSEILDRNLLAIQQAMEQANITIQKQQTTINRIISGDINISVVGPAGPPGMPGSDAGDGGDGDALSVSIPGPPGVRGRDGVGIPGQDAEEVDAIVIPGRDGRPGRDGALVQAPGDNDGDAAPLFVPGSPESDRVSFHFYIDHTTGALGPTGVLLPSDKAPFVQPAPPASGYLPSVRKVYRRGEILLYIVANALVGGETYNAQVLVNGGATSTSSVVSFTSGSAGFIYAEFLTGSTAALDNYVIQVGGNASTKAVQYSAVLRLYER